MLCGLSSGLVRVQVGISIRIVVEGEMGETVEVLLEGGGVGVGGTLGAL